MKLQNELQPTIEKMQAFKAKYNENEIVQYMQEVKDSKKYKVLENRLAWDFLKYSVHWKVRGGWFDDYNCHDSHIETLAKKAFFEVFAAEYARVK